MMIPARSLERLGGKASGFLNSTAFSSATRPMSNILKPLDSDLRCERTFGSFTVNSELKQVYIRPATQVAGSHQDVW
jgi:hypothetical protein